MTLNPITACACGHRSSTVWCALLLSFSIFMHHRPTKQRTSQGNDTIRTSSPHKFTSIVSIVSIVSYSQICENCWSWKFQLEHVNFIQTQKETKNWAPPSVPSAQYHDTVWTIRYQALKPGCLDLWKGGFYLHCTSLESYYKFWTFLLPETPKNYTGEWSPPRMNLQIHNTSRSSIYILS